MKTLRLISVVATLVLVAGCARFSTTQTEVRNEQETKITTKATAYTLFQGQSQLANWKAEQSEGSQGAEVGTLNQSTDAGTNLVNVLEATTKLAEALYP